MMKKIVFLLLTPFLVNSCVSRENISEQRGVNVYMQDSSAIKLNNQAVSIIGMVSVSGGDSLNNLLYDSALCYLDLAIKTDSLYVMAYTNKAHVLQRKGLLEKAVKVLNEVQTIRPDFAEAIMGQGLILEKMGNLELAEQKYAQSLDAYKKRLRDDPENIKAQSDIAFLYIFLGDKNKAIDEIQNLILENPDNEALKAMAEYIKGFDRKQFIEEY